MKKILVFIVLKLLVISFIFTQSSSLVNWMSIEEAEKKQKEAPKTILIDMYTDWCGWCKRMDETTFNNPAIANYINTNFYPVKFNAESRDTVKYMDKTYINEGTGNRPSHQFAQMLMGGRMSYPTIVYVDDDFRAYPVPGYMDPTRIESILVYFAERINKNCDYADFEKDYKNTFDPEFNEDKDSDVNWIDFDLAMKKMKTNPKKLILFFNSEYINGSKLLVNSVFKHPIVTKYMNENFYSVKINYDTKDTLEILGNTFTNPSEQRGYPHQLTIALLQPEVRMPAIVFFDSDFSLIFALRGYFPSKVMERYFSFISQDLFKTENWEKFNAEFVSEIE